MNDDSPGIDCLTKEKSPVGFNKANSGNLYLLYLETSYLNRLMQRVASQSFNRKHIFFPKGLICTMNQANKITEATAETGLSLRICKESGGTFIFKEEMWLDRKSSLVMNFGNSDKLFSVVQRQHFYFRHCCV